MHVYKFRILSEEQNDFVRDIEICSTQTFEDFHKIILKSTGLDGKELASFHITNGKWIKLKEITLIDMLEGQSEIESEEEEEEQKGKILPQTYVMRDCKLKDFIDDPHQRLIYEYDFLHLKTFFIELIQISQAKSNVKYPVCTRSNGQLELKPKNAKPKPGSDMDVPEDVNIEELRHDIFFNDDDEDMESNSNFDLDDGFEEFKPL